MITGGKGSGSGRYSYQKRHSGQYSVTVAHMPEDDMHVRITFKHMDEINIPIIKLNEKHAEMLWACLNSMAQDLKWKDFE